jgi:superfamily II DNA or RNA helicase
LTFIDIEANSSIKNFPFSITRPTIRGQQSFVLREIDLALAAGYKLIILECRTGFGKSAVAIAVALTYGTSYIIVSTKDLQLTQKENW